MDTLDAPESLLFNKGNSLPNNFLIIVYIALAGSITLLFSQLSIMGIIIFLPSLFVITSKHMVHIDLDKSMLHDYTQYLFFIKIGKKYPLEQYKYITTMPLIEGQQVYSSSSHSTSISHSFTTVTLFGERLTKKRIITKFASKSEAEDLGKRLADRLKLKYFEYDPKLAREVLLGQRTL